MSVVRLRKTPLLSDVVQSCDAFSKVLDDVKEEKKTTGGLSKRWPRLLGPVYEG